jgi:helicase
LRGVRLEPIPESATRVTRRLAELMGYRGLFPPQRAALDAGVERGESVLVSAPTGAGKTFIALVAAANAVEREGGRAFYVAPLRSIAQEKYREFRVLERLGLKVKVSVGDYAEGPPEADVVISTYEKLDAMLRGRPEAARDISVLVVDEVHMVGDPERGPVLEGLVARLMARARPQIVALSATVPNAGEIAEWLGAKLVESTWRPVPLKEGVFKDHVVYYPGGERRMVAKRTGLPDVDLIMETLDSGGQAIVFTQSRKRAEALAKRAAGRLGLGGRECREAAAEVRRAGWGPASLRESLAELVERCVAFHHAGLPSEARRLVEDSFRSGVVAAVYSTPTLAAGVNLPARLVVVDEYYRYRGGVKEPIRVSEYKQLAGRAGRPGYDEEGEAIIVASTYDSPQELLEEYVLGEPERVESRLSGLRGLRHFILGVVASGEAGSVVELGEILRATLYARQRGLPRGYVARALYELEEWGLIERDYSRLAPTPLGVEVARLYLDPENVPVVRGLSGLVDPSDELSLLYLVSASPDMVLLSVTQKEVKTVAEEAERRSPRLAGRIDPQDPLEARRLKTAMVLQDWVNEVSDDDIYERWGVAPGDLSGLKDTAEWIASSLSRIHRDLGLPEEAGPALRLLAARVRHGVKPELLPLVQLPGVGRVKARILYNAGYRSLHDLAVASPRELLRLRGIGPSTVRSIMEALGRREEAERLSRLADSERRGLAAFMD